jgi:hypothetical protein
VPFLNVSVSALAGRGRIPALQLASGAAGYFHFQGYVPAFQAMWALEGPLGLFTVRWFCGVLALLYCPHASIALL